MAHLYVNPDSDSIYLDVTSGGGSPATMEEPADGVYLHLDEAGIVVAVEVMDMNQRGTLDLGQLGQVHVNPDSDAIYVDVSAGIRTSTRMAAVAEGVFLHEDSDGTLVGVEMTNVRARGGLQVEDLDATRASPRPAMFDEIERAASNSQGGHPRPG